MRNTWWVTRPKRSLVSVQLCLTALANVADGKNWSKNRVSIEQSFEQQLEVAGLKRIGDRRDRSGGGARTYRSWLKSLGLLFVRDDGTLRLTYAGEELVAGKPPLDILTKQVLEYQYPSAFSHQGGSAVDHRFQLRPFIFLLQLLRDERLEGFLDEKKEIAKIVICYAEQNTDDSVDLVVQKILDHRVNGDNSLEPDYEEKFRSKRSASSSRSQLFARHGDIANTFANWLGYTQLIVRNEGKWFLANGVAIEVDGIIAEYQAKPLISRWDEEEVFQRKYGLPPGKTKDTRNLNDTKSVTALHIQERSIYLAYMSLLSTRIVREITTEILQEVSDKTGATIQEVDRVLATHFPASSVGLFMNRYAQLAFESRKNARQFEKATASIYSEIFRFETLHIGDAGPYPDIVISSTSEKYSAILDSKAYKDGYSITIAHQNRMRDYIEQYSNYAQYPFELAFFTYVVSEHKKTVEGQLQNIHKTNGVPGSVITARNIIRLVQKYEEAPISHATFKKLFSQNSVVSMRNIDWASNPAGLLVELDEENTKSPTHQIFIDKKGS